MKPKQWSRSAERPAQAIGEAYFARAALMEDERKTGERTERKRDAMPIPVTRTCPSLSMKKFVGFISL